MATQILTNELSASRLGCRLGLHALATFFITLFVAGFPAPARAEDNGNVYGFMRSEWQRSQPQRAATSSFFQRAVFQRPMVQRAAPRRSSFATRVAYRPAAKAARVAYASQVSRQRVARIARVARVAQRRYASVVAPVVSSKPAPAPKSRWAHAAFVQPRASRTTAYSTSPPSSPPEQFDDESAAVPMEVTGDVTYCVRLCDGFFLPMSYSSSVSTEKAGKTCAQTWPNAETAVYKSNDLMAGIEAAHALKGREPYTALPTAYAYRHEGGPTQNMCSGPQRVENREIWNDPTLRKGDIFVSDAGAMVFSGNSGRGGPPYTKTDFSPVSKAQTKANKDVRALVEALSLKAPAIPKAQRRE